jgi:hypothetical protein
MLVCFGVVVGLVVIAGVAFFAFDASMKRRAAEALAARGAVLGDWTVYYDTKANRIGLIATFGEEHLVRYLLFRLHDLFDYNQGLEPERRRLADLFTAAARGLPSEDWTFLFNPPKTETYHAYDSPQATLFKFFDGKLYENAIDQPRFIGGDAIAKQKGLVGEIIALTHHLGATERGAVTKDAIARMVEKELREGRAPEGARFWNLPTQTLREIAS